MRTLVIKYKDPRKLKPRLKNPRTHSPRQIKQIAASITEFGFINPVLIDGADEIVAGHARVIAAISLGMMDVPTPRGHSTRDAGGVTRRWRWGKWQDLR